MAVKSKEQLKEQFSGKEVPDQVDFEDLIDSQGNQIDDAGDVTLGGVGDVKFNSSENGVVGEDNSLNYNVESGQLRVSEDADSINNPLILNDSTPITRISSDGTLGGDDIVTPIPAKPGVSYIIPTQKAVKTWIDYTDLLGDGVGGSFVDKYGQTWTVVDGKITGVS
jgi:hypothetical protein